MSDTENSNSKETKHKNTTKSFSSELVEMNVKHNKYVKALIIITSLSIITCIVISMGMSFINHRVSNILLSYENQRIKFQLNKVILYMFFGFFTVTKTLVIVSLSFNQDNYLLEVLYKCNIYIIILCDFIMITSIGVGTFVKNVEIMIIISIILGAVECVSAIYNKK